MNEYAILEVLKAIENHIGMVAGMMLAIFMLAVAALFIAIVNSNKK